MLRLIGLVGCGILAASLVQGADPKTATTDTDPPITKVEL